MTTIADALRYWSLAKRGAENVVVSDEHLDALEAHFTANPSQEADVYFSSSSTIHNPNRLGVRDQYILRLSASGRAKLA